jgi:hypothetical protein
MPPPSRSSQSILAIDQFVIEWRTLGRSEQAVAALHRLALNDLALSDLVHGTGTVGSPLCPTPYDLIEHMRLAKDLSARNQAAAVIRLMLREGNTDPLIIRILLQALLPGMISIAVRLQWGRGGDWKDAEEFFSELLSTSWFVLMDWAGQDRQYAVLDLLSAVRCRLRRQLLRAKELEQRTAHPTIASSTAKSLQSETDLELLTRGLIDLMQEGMRTEDVEVLYAHHVLGYSISELATLTGRNRRALYARRDRGHRRICA